MLFWVLKDKEESERRKAYDATWIAFLFAAFFWYIGAFLGGQTYGVIATGPLSIDYSLTNPYLGEFTRFPLAATYAILTGVIFSFCYMFRKAHKEDGLSAFLGVALFWLMILIGEFWNPSSHDNISSLFGTIHAWRLLNINQIWALVMLLWSLHHIVVELDLPVGDGVKRMLRIWGKKEKGKRKKK